MATLFFQRCLILASATLVAGLGVPPTLRAAEPGEPAPPAATTTPTTAPAAARHPGTSDLSDPSDPSDPSETGDPSETADPSARSGAADQSDPADRAARIVAQVDAARDQLAGLGQGDAAARNRLIDETFDGVLKNLGPDQPLGQLLEAARSDSAKAGGNAKSPADAAFKALLDIRDTLAFEPVMEAPLAPDFPKPGPAGLIVRKTYPVARAVVANADRAETGGQHDLFMSLFRHIQKNDVKMTTPVEMEYGQDGRQTQMAFMYERPDQGALGNDGRLTVADLPAASFVSLGKTGYISIDDVAAATKQLRGWVEQHDTLRPAGAPRVLGYNSPFLPPWKQYYEVQLPVRATQAGEDHTTNSMDATARDAASPAKPITASTGG